MNDSPARLKRYNLGAVLSLHRDDLFIGQYFPTNNGVHMARFIVRTDGAYEFGEYQILPDTGQLFWHYMGQLAPADLEAMKSLLADLGQIWQQIDFQELEDSGEEYEEQQRRLIRHWCGGSQIWATRPAADYFRDVGVDAGLVAEFVTRFEAAWASVSHWIEHARQAAGPPSGPPVR